MKSHSIAFILSSYMLISACNHTLETDLPGAVSLQPNSFQFANTTESRSNAYILAQKLVRDKLVGRGFNHTDNGQIYVTITLSDRDALSAISTKSEQGAEVISKARDKAFLKTCKDRAVRLAVVLNDIKDGKTLYKGSATRYRCEFDEARMVKALVDAAISDLRHNR